MFGNKSIGEIYTLLTAVMCGISMLLPVGSIVAAPLYIMRFYQYVMQDANAVAVHTNFWNNSLTYYILIGFGMSLILEPLTLSETFRRIPLQVRMLSSLTILWVEIILLMVVPAVGSTEKGAIGTLVGVSLIASVGKSIFEATAYGFFGAFPSRFTTALMGGAGVAGAVTSILQIVVKAALPEDYEGIRTQSKIFYGLMVAIHVITFVMLIILRFIPFSRNYIDTLGKKKVGGVEIDEEASETHKNGMSEVHEPNNGDAVDENERNNNNNNNNSDTIASIDENPHADAEGLVNANILGVLKCVYPMLIACSFNFFVTLYLFPTIVISVDADDYWYGTVAVCIFSITDVFGRFSPSVKIFWPPRCAVIAGSFARAIFIPLIILASYHYIPSHAYNYVMMVLFGLSNGYIGTFALLMGPLSEGLTTHGQRFVAGTMLGIAILVGGSVGTGLSIMTQTVREHNK